MGQTAKAVQIFRGSGEETAVFLIFDHLHPDGFVVVFSITPKQYGVARGLASR